MDLKLAISAFDGKFGAPFEEQTDEWKTIRAVVAELAKTSHNSVKDAIAAAFDAGENYGYSCGEDPDYPGKERYLRQLHL